MQPAFGRSSLYWSRRRHWEPSQLSPCLCPVHRNLLDSGPKVHLSGPRRWDSRLPWPNTNSIRGGNLAGNIPAPHSYVNKAEKCKFMKKGSRDVSLDRKDLRTVCRKSMLALGGSCSQRWCIFRRLTWSTT